MNTTTKKGISAFGLKYIALLTMTIDHAGLIFLSYDTMAYTIARNIGRIAFPLYCFLLVEGFLHTSNRRSYFIRLLLFAFISEIPFDMMVYRFPQITDMSVLNGHQNVYFTLAFGFLALCLIDHYRSKGPYVALAIGAFFVMAAELLQTDYSYIGIFVILLFYMYKTFAADQNLLLGYLLPILPLLSYGNYFVLLAIPFLFLYNGQKGQPLLPGGNSFPGAKYIFYLYYPLHLAILSIIGYWIL